MWCGATPQPAHADALGKRTDMLCATGSVRHTAGQGCHGRPGRQGAPLSLPPHQRHPGLLPGPRGVRRRSRPPPRKPETLQPQAPLRVGAWVRACDCGHLPAQVHLARAGASSRPPADGLGRWHRSPLVPGWEATPFLGTSRRPLACNAPSPSRTSSPSSARPAGSDAARGNGRRGGSAQLSFCTLPTPRARSLPGTEHAKGARPHPLPSSPRPGAAPFHRVFSAGDCRDQSLRWLMPMAWHWPARTSAFFSPATAAMPSPSKPPCSALTTRRVQAQGSLSSPGPSARRCPPTDCVAGGMAGRAGRPCGSLDRGRG